MRTASPRAPGVARSGSTSTVTRGATTVASSAVARWVARTVIVPGVLRLEAEREAPDRAVRVDRDLRDGDLLPAAVEAHAHLLARRRTASACRARPSASRPGRRRRRPRRASAGACPSRRGGGAGAGAGAGAGVGRLRRGGRRGDEHRQRRERRCRASSCDANATQGSGAQRRPDASAGPRGHGPADAAHEREDAGEDRRARSR